MEIISKGMRWVGTCIVCGCKFTACRLEIHVTDTIYAKCPECGNGVTMAETGAKEKQSKAILK